MATWQPISGDLLIAEPVSVRITQKINTCSLQAAQGLADSPCVKWKKKSFIGPAKGCSFKSSHFSSDSNSSRQIKCVVRSKESGSGEVISSLVREAGRQSFNPSQEYIEMELERRETNGPHMWLSSKMFTLTLGHGKSRIRRLFLDERRESHWNVSLLNIFK